MSGTSSYTDFSVTPTISGLSAGTSHNISYNNHLVGSQNRTYDFIVCADSTNSVNDESDETNNCSLPTTVVFEVPPAPPAPTVDLKVNGSDNLSSVLYGSTVNLTWTSTNATSCTGTGFSTGNATNNTNGVTSPSNTLHHQTYSISCTGAGGTATDSAIVHSRPGPAPFTSSSNSCSLGAGKIHVTWDAGG
ncbi:MAG: hypothetical protein COV70_02480, partial [Parcubacteria group bacterium CG11_big_fil_rev_8_21_14_0_20_39_22]